jgi:flagellar biosynthesis repressor protein FlbT
MNITLRAGERFFINGAVIRVDRKASIELLNEVTFLLENHVMQPDEATTLVRQIYFAVQIMLMDPTGGRNFEALKALRGLFALEDKELRPPAETPSAA